MTSVKILPCRPPARLINEWVGDQSEEVRGVVDCFGSGCENIFFKLAPDAAEQEFGGGFASGIFPDESGVQCDTFALFDVTHFVLGCLWY